MANTIVTNPPLVRATTREFQKGYVAGKAFLLGGELIHGHDDQPDEQYLINNLVFLAEDGAFSDMPLLRWHIGFLMGVVDAGRQIEIAHQTMLIEAEEVTNSIL
jgi:hypothetical protein